MGCLQDVKNPIVLDLSRHVDLKYKVLVDYVKMASISIHYVPLS